MAKFLGTTKKVRKSQIKDRNLRLKKNKKPRDFRHESKVNYQNQNGEYGQKIIDNRQNNRQKVTSEISQQNPKWESMKQKLDYVHITLDVAGMFPGLGIVPDAINTGLYALRGDWVNAGLSATAMIPGIGQGATGAKYAYKAGKAVKQSKNNAQKASKAAKRQRNLSDHETIYKIVNGENAKVPPRNPPEIINGRSYSGHAIDRMQERGLTPTLVDNTLKTATPVKGKVDGTIAYYDSVNKITVITNESGRVITVAKGQIKQ